MIDFPFLNYIHTALNWKPTDYLVVSLIATLGIILGSFMNVVIYRLSAQYEPGNYQGKLTVSEPKGSFCPDCLTPLTWLENIPLISYIIQLGKCKHCHKSISIQYPLVEAITCTLLTYLWITSPTIGAFLPNALLVLLLIPCAGIDIKTHKIPNSLTIWGGLTLLVIASATKTNLKEILYGPLFGYVIAGLGTYLAVEFGKIAFGKKKVEFPKLKEVAWEKIDGNFFFTIQEDEVSLQESEKMPLEEVFTRKSDYIRLEGQLTVTITNNQKIACRKATVKFNGITVEEESKKTFYKDATLLGKVKIIYIPQEAMGMGDVKLMALIGAGLGAMGALHTITLGATLAVFFFLGLRIAAKIKKQNPPNVVAFGPWIAGAAILLLFL